MFGSIRDKLHNVQEGISASFRVLTVSEPVSRKSKTLPGRKVNLNAGAELLEKYQTEWKELHIISEENAKNAEIVDQSIGSLYKNSNKQWTDIGQLCSSISEVPNLIIRVQDLMEQINTLKNTFEEVEHSLLELEDLVETQALREEQLDHRFQLAMYKEKKLAEFEDFRKKLDTEHAEKLKKHEERQKSILLERQAAFGKAFNDEMDEFKKSGHIPKMDVRHKEISLEEVDLDSDEAALDDFLQDIETDKEAGIDSNSEAKTLTPPADSSFSD